jgi:predicted acetyltransferase
MRLVAATLEAPPGLLDAYRELGPSEHGFAGDIEVAAGTLPMREHLQRLVDMAGGHNLAPGLIPMTSFWLLGVSRLRHYLTPRLFNDGGHIGYYVRPGFRRRGYGREILALTLPHARTLGLSRVLLTVDADNVPSIRVVQANGGIREDERNDLEGVRYGRYWIDLGR